MSNNDRTMNRDEVGNLLHLWNSLAHTDGPTPVADTAVEFDDTVQALGEPREESDGLEGAAAIEVAFSQLLRSVGRIPDRGAVRQMISRLAERADLHAWVEHDDPMRSWHHLVRYVSRAFMALKGVDDELAFECLDALYFDLTTFLGGLYREYGDGHSADAGEGRPQ